MQINMVLGNMSPADFETLKRNALDARQHSYSPYSKFRVGCCIMLKSKACIIGANVENASYGGAICAERTAIVKAVTSNHKDDWLCMAISGDSLDSCISPCGICRQVIREFGDLRMPIVMFNGDGSKHVIRTLQELLPLSFGPDDLAE